MTGQGRILVIGMADSIHVARWLDIAMAGTEVDVLFVPTSPHRRVHSSIHERSKSSPSFKIHPVLRYLSLFFWVLDRNTFRPNYLRSLFIERAIKSFRPDLIHVLETQNGGYPFALAANRLASAGQKLPKTMLTLFGSDLYWFRQFPSHLGQIKKLLEYVSLMSAECARDLNFAREFGFKGDSLPLIPVAGGLPDELVILPESQSEFDRRKSIAVKGYGRPWGLGHKAITELAALSDELKEFRIEVFSASRSTARFAKKTLASAELNFSIYKKFELNHDQMLSLYRRSRIYVGLSKSDGLPASMLEAMSQGCYPIQSSSACFEGWVEPGSTAAIVDNERAGDLRNAILSSLRDTDRLQRVQRINLATIQEKYSTSALLVKGAFTYSELLKP